MVYIALKPEGSIPRARVITITYFVTVPIHQFTAIIIISGIIIDLHETYFNTTMKTTASVGSTNSNAVPMGRLI